MPGVRGMGGLASAAARFEALVDRDGTNGCWRWLGYVGENRTHCTVCAAKHGHSPEVAIDLNPKPRPPYERRPEEPVDG